MRLVTSLPDGRSPEFAEERRTRILEIVNARGRVTVTDLAEQLNASQPTIRKDISALDRQHKLRRTHGGALAARPSYELRLDSRLDANAEAKRRIAAACLTLISPNDSIFLDAGTTSLAIAETLVEAADQRTEDGPVFGHGLNVLTNSVPVARTLASSGSVHHALVGGQYRRLADSLVGPLALQAIKQFTVNLAFIGVTGLSGDQFSVADLAEADLKRTVMGHSHRIVVPMDSSKVGVTDFVTLNRLNAIGTLVTEQADDYLTELCTGQGVELLIAP